MDPRTQFCPNMACPARGEVGAGNIGVHPVQPGLGSRAERRYICRRCGKTFAETTGTPFYKRQYTRRFISDMISLIAHGCPLQAIVNTFRVDERTVADWVRSSGPRRVDGTRQHCQEVHMATVQQGQLDLGQVQADELRVKAQGQIFWMALALAVNTRLPSLVDWTRWLGGVVSQKRDTSLVLALALYVKACALARPLLICFDGFRGYLEAFRKAFRTPLREGKLGRPRLIPWPNIALGQVVKETVGRRLVGVKRRLVQGDEAAVQALLISSQGGGVLNTAFIERLNATFRAQFASLVRRTRALARTEALLGSGMYLVGCVYNFCTWHESLRLPLYITERRHRWVQRTPALAAGLTDHCWSVLELLLFKVPPSPYVPPKRRGRPPKTAPAAIPA